jgi:DNA mismatch repair ATPase MutS
MLQSSHAPRSRPLTSVWVCMARTAKVEIGLFRNVMTRIQSCESVTTMTSTFGNDLAQVRSMMRSATADSLLLIDEFGAHSQFP